MPHARINRASASNNRLRASEGDERANEDGRANNSGTSSDRCAIDPVLLLTPHVSRSAGTGRSERPGAVIAPLVARQCRHPARHRFHSVVRSAQSMPTAKPIEHRPVLGRCFDRPSCDPFPTSDSQLDCRVDMQMRGVKYAFWLAGIIAALLIVWYLWLSKGTPPGQPALRSLAQNNFHLFKHDFNSAGDEARLVLLLSPT